MIGRMCKVGDGLSRPVLIARETFSKRKIMPIEAKSLSKARRKATDDLFSQVIYCRGYSGEEPPLPIPNREVKLTIADGTAPPGGRVGSCGSSKVRESDDSRTFFFEEPHLPALTLPPPCFPPLGGGRTFIKKVVYLHPKKKHH